MQNTKIIIGVMGPGNEAGEKDIRNAFELGKLIAQEGWVLLTGGRNAGVMDSASKGAKSEGGLTIGILTEKDNSQMSDSVDIAIVTGMGSARNNINILSSKVVIICGMGKGTASEACLALKAKKSIILLTENALAKEFFSSLDKEKVIISETPADVMKKAKQLLETI